MWTAHLGRSLGLFQTIYLQNPDRNSLCGSLGLNFAAVDPWCSAAISFGYITERRGRLGMSQKMFRLLVESDDEENIGGQFSYLALRSLNYDSMADFFSDGKTIPDQTFEAVNNATEWDHHAVLRYILTRKDLVTLLRTGCDVLDVGCGTGLFLRKLKKAFPLSRLSGVDASHLAIDLAKGNLEGLGADIAVADAAQLDFESRFDLVHLGEVLYSTANKPLVMSNCHKALRAGGRVLVVEGLLPESRDGHEHREKAVITGMALDFALYGHSFLKKSELKRLLRESGFVRVRLEDLGGCLFLAEATKG